MQVKLFDVSKLFTVKAHLVLYLRKNAYYGFEDEC